MNRKHRRRHRNIKNDQGAHSTKRKKSDKLTAMSGKPAVAIEVERSPKSKWKVFGGGDRDQWNDRLLNLVTRALPVDQHNAEAVSRAGSAVAAGTVDEPRRSN
jgi:hypothetical protein